MDTHTFLQAVLGDSGYYCLLCTSVTNKKKRVQKFYPTIEALVNAAYAADQNELDAYFALSTFREAGSREGGNSESLRSIFLDLDCGPEKEFPNQSAALKALQAFCKKTGLRRPYMVNSGRGVHVYWPLTEPVSPGLWKPVAMSLKAACKALGFPADRNVTGDVARVLRVPLTHNHKDTPPAPVKVLQGGEIKPYDLEEFAALFSAYAAPVSAAPELPFKNALMTLDEDPVMKRLLQDRISRFKTILVKSSEGRGCAQIKYAFDNQEDLSEPLWRGALSIAKFCVDSRMGAKAMSSRHPEYNEADTHAKMDGIAGPHKCATFEDVNPDACEGCPLKGKITSPIQLGSEVEAAPEEPAVVEELTITGESKEYVIPTYPRPYFRGTHGGVYVKDVDDSGDPIDVIVYANDLYFVGRVQDHSVGECVVGRVHLPMDGVREFVIPLVHATSKEDLRKALATAGVAAIGREWDRLMAYTNTWIQNLQTTIVADDARAQFGWTNDNFESFVVGSREIKADDIGYNPPSSTTSWLFPAFEPAGTLEGWIEDARFYDRPEMEPHQHMICMSLGSPLMRFLPVHAAIYDMYSDGSGHGKTTTQKFSLSIYGNPNDLMVTASDTLNARINRLEVMKDVAVQFDEFTEFPADDMSELIYQAHSGRQKARMSSGSNSERFRGAPWHLTIGVSSNASMLSKVHSVKSAPRAEIQRVLDHHVKPHNFSDKSETDLFAASVGKNRGMAIVPFIQYIINNRDTVIQLLDRVQRKIDLEAGLTAQNRFWSIHATVTLTALIIAKELGLLSYDVKALHDYEIGLIKANKKADIESTNSIETIVNDYVNDNYGSILWIKSTEDLRGGNNNGLDSLAVPEQQPRMKFVARYETDTKNLFLVPKPLRAWCAKNRINYDSFVKEALSKLKGRKGKVRLSKGTKMNLPPTDVIILACASMDLPEGPDGGSED